MRRAALWFTAGYENVICGRDELHRRERRRAERYWRQHYPLARDCVFLIASRSADVNTCDGPGFQMPTISGAQIDADASG